MIGKPTVRQLIEAGHDVVGMTRREERAAEIRGAGAEAVVCDALDAEALRDAVVAARPEVVLHALTALPQRFKPKSDYLADTNRVRIEGTRNLVAAARAAAARRVVADGVAFFYEPEGDRIKAEEAPLFRDPPGRFAAACDALTSLENQVLEAGEPEGMVLRFGWFYGPGTHFDRGGMIAEDTLKRRYPVIGKGEGVYSFIHVEDAAAAHVAALDHGSAGVYNVVDDDPVPLHERLPDYAAELGAKPPPRVPVWVARLAAGEDLASTAITMRGASNAKARRELGWQPSHPGWRQGFAAALS